MFDTQRTGRKGKGAKGRLTRDGDMTVPTRCKLLLLFERRFFNFSSAVVCTDVKLHLETVNRFPSEVQGDKVIAIRLLSPKEGTGGKWGPMPSAISFHFISFSSFPELHLVYSTSRFSAAHRGVCSQASNWNVKDHKRSWGRRGRVELDQNHLANNGNSKRLNWMMGWSQPEETSCLPQCSILNEVSCEIQTQETPIPYCSSYF